MVFNISGPEQVRPKEWQNALKSCSFKTSFYRYLAKEWSKDSYSELIKDHQIYFALDNVCYVFTASDGKVIKQDIQDLESYHEEADTRMVYHLHYKIQHQDVTNISIRSNDTDFLVILLY